MIQINSLDIPVEPTTLNEYYEKIETDNVSLSGAMQRNRRNKKKVVEMGFTLLTPAEYNALLALFEDGDAVDYANPESNRAAFQTDDEYLPTITNEGEYVKGGDFKRESLNVTLRET